MDDPFVWRGPDQYRAPVKAGPSDLRLVATPLAIGIDNGLHTAPKRAVGAGDEGLVQSVSGLGDVSLQ